MRWLNAKIHFTHHICLWGGRGAGRRGENKLVGEGFKALGWELDVPSLLLSEPSLPGENTGWAPLNFTSKAGARLLQPSPSLLSLLSPFSWYLSFAPQRRLFPASPGFALVAFLGSYSPALPPFASFIYVPDPSPADVIL